MLIRFTKNTPTHHTFEIIREDGSRESVSLETRSFMPHDLIHYAYESLAGCKESFYGLLARGMSLSDLGCFVPRNDGNMDLKNVQPYWNTEMINTERITGPLTGYLKGDMDNDDFLAAIRQLFEAHGIAMPAHVTHTFLDTLKEHFRQLMGRWNALPHHVPMELKW